MAPCPGPADGVASPDVPPEPPPPLPYEEPVAGPAGRVLGRTFSLLFAPVLGLAAGAAVALAVTQFAARVGEAAGGSVTSPAVVSVLVATLFWAGWRGVVRVRDGSMEFSAAELCVWSALLPLLVVLLISLSTIVYALNQ